MPSSKLMIGFGSGNGRDPGAMARGVRMPSLTISANSGSASLGLRSVRGGPSSATTRSRFVTSTVSPAAAMRTYALSLLLSLLMPTDLMGRK